MGEVAWLKGRLWLAAFVATLGIAEIAFAVQVRTWHGRGSWSGDPDKKVLVSTWLASEMWVNPWLLMAGVTTVILAVVSVLMYPRLADRRGARDQ